MGLQVGEWVALGVKVTIISLMSYYASNYMLEMLEPRDRKKRMENVSEIAVEFVGFCGRASRSEVPKRYKQKCNQKFNQKPNLKMGEKFSFFRPDNCCSQLA